MSAFIFRFGFSILNFRFQLILIIRFSLAFVLLFVFLFFNWLTFFLFLLDIIHEAGRSGLLILRILYRVPNSRIHISSPLRYFLSSLIAFIFLFLGYLIFY